MADILAERSVLVRQLCKSQDRGVREYLYFEIAILDAKAGLDEDRHLAEFVAGVGS
jgi:hypothetical protein